MSAHTPRFLIRGGRFFDGSESKSNYALLVEGAKIVRFAPAQEFEGIDAAILDNAEGTTLPGLFDCHVHLVFDALADATQNTRAAPSQQILRIQRNAHLALQGGMTTVRDLGACSDREPMVRDAIDAGLIPGPKIIVGGFMTITGGHGSWIDSSVQVDGEHACRRKVREYVALNLDWIKITASGGVFTKNSNPFDETFSLEEVTAIVNEAKRFGRRVTAHALGAAGIGNAVRAGIASIEHGFQLTDEIIEEMVAKGIYLVPTFSASESLYRAAHEGLGVPTAVLDKAASYSELRTNSFRSFVKAGGKVAMGTDAGTPFNKHGENPRELQFMVQRGLSPMQALKSATANAAELCSQPSGSLRDGAPADLLLVSGDATTDILCVADQSNHRLVVKAGQPVSRGAHQPWALKTTARTIVPNAAFG